jgi:pseudouridine-5'-phosphate glycosidase
MDIRKFARQAPILVSPDIEAAIENEEPVVALESAVLTHGLPYPRSLALARRLEEAVREAGARPATVAVFKGRIRVGLTDAELAELAQSPSRIKVGPRDFARAMFEGASGGTTVAATMFAASRAGIQVFATGGIGGVHKENAFDVSPDLEALATTGMIVVCSGAKAVLDLAATMEVLETRSVPVVGYRTDVFPAFYSRESGLDVTMRLDSPEAVAKYWAAHKSMGAGSAVLVANPIPEAWAIPYSEMEPLINRASGEAKEQMLRGQALTPFLLRRVSELSDGRSMAANEALLANNARLAGEIAVCITSTEVPKETQK